MSKREQTHLTAIAKVFSFDEREAKVKGRGNTTGTHIRVSVRYIYVANNSARVLKIES